MSFRENLQHLRAHKGMTQEQLAMMVGVSRQSVTKWESDKAYPEMDKLLALCGIFDCTLDELVQGDLTQREPRGPVMPAQASSDVCGYDEHMRSFAFRIATGISICIAGVGFTALFDFFFGDALSFMPLALGAAVMLAFVLPAAAAHGRFKKKHPYIEDFYTDEERDLSSKRLMYGIAGGVAVILAGISVATFFEAGAYSETASTAILFAAAVGVWCFVYFGLMSSRTNLEEYNLDTLGELPSHKLDEVVSDDAERARIKAYARKNEVIGAACAIIMISATALALGLLFLDTPADEVFWVPWVIGGVLCGLAAVIVRLVMKDGE